MESPPNEHAENHRYENHRYENHGKSIRKTPATKVEEVRKNKATLRGLSLFGAQVEDSIR